MPGNYQVKDYDWISKIAKSLKHNDGGEKLWNANSQLLILTGNNRHVLEPGWTLKDPGNGQPGQYQAKIDTSNPYEVSRQKKQLVLTFYEYLGKDHTSVYCQVYIDNKLVFKGDSFTGKIVIPFVDKKTGQTIIDETSLEEATLVVQVMRRGVQHGPPQKIKLNIGGLTPLSKQDGSVSVTGLQKILTNLGYAPGPVDGLYNAKTQAAVRAFQADHQLTITSIPDFLTCSKLIELIETPMRSPTRFPNANDPIFTPMNDPATKPATGAPLPLGDSQYFQKNALWDPYEAWIDRAAPSPEDVVQDNSQKTPYKVLKGDQTGLRLYDTTRRSNDPPDAAFGGVPKEGIRFYPQEVYVAPADEGDDSNKNPIWMLKYRSVFLDCGGWIKDQYDFAVLHGWHAYLCKYVPKEKRDGTVPTVLQPSDGNLRMDHKFFQALKDAVVVEKCISVVWAEQTEFDWQNLILIIPDLHLMTGLTANVWKNNSSDQNGPFYDLRAELNLFAFANEITAAPALQQNLQVIQLGDTYDLWIGSPNILGHEAPLFTQNKSSSVVLEQPEDIKFGDNKNYRDHADLVAQKWSKCGIGDDFDAGAVDMRLQVLQWWVEAIQGLRNSPLEQSGVQLKPPNDPWVKWILERRSIFNYAAVWQLGNLRKDYANGLFTGNQVAEKLAADYPVQFERVPYKPTMVRGTKLNPFQPDAPVVRSWFDSIEEQLNTFEKGCKDYCAYVNSNLNGTWLNPAQAALQIFQTNYGGVQYLYGNHDNYLIRPEVVGNVCDPRVRFIEGQGIWIEHAHRLEPGLMPPANANYDGNQKGYTLTNSVWRPRAEKILPGVKAKFGEGISDKLGEQADASVTGISQLYYRREAGRFFVARSVLGGSLPHIFIIGHTHAPMMQVNYVHLNDASDLRGPGNQSWGDDEGI